MCVVSVRKSFTGGGPFSVRLLSLPMSFRRLDLDALWLSDLQVSKSVWWKGVRVCGGEV